MGNGTDALWLTFMALGIGPGDECITHPNTFFATAEAIWIAGATAVFVDSDPFTNCIDPSRIEAAITPRTKALVPVHLYGQCADMKAIHEIAGRHGLFVIEDNAQGIGARGDGFRIGELSDAACTSFIIQKNLGCFGDGGAVVTNRDQIDRPHVSALSRPGTRPGIRPVMPRPRRSTVQDGAGFLLPFGRRPSLLGHPVPPGDSAPLTTAVLGGHRDTEKPFCANTFEDLTVGRFVGLVPFAGLVGERPAELLGASLQVLLFSCQSRSPWLTALLFGNGQIHCFESHVRYLSSLTQLVLITRPTPLRGSASRTST